MHLHQFIIIITEVDAIVANINFSDNHYTKTEVDAIIDELSALILNTYTKSETDTQLTDYMTSLAISETLMNNYTSIPLLVASFYDKTETDNLLADLVTTDYLHLKYTNTVDLPSVYYNKTETDNMLLSYSTGSYVDANFYNKTDTGNLLANKVSNIGDISLPGWLDIGTSGYTNSRIRCNAVVGGHTGYAELKANGSWDMFLNLQTTYPNGGWMYFAINNDIYMQ